MTTLSMRALSLLVLLAALPSAAQPALIAEADPGSGDGSITELVAHDGVLYFSGKGAGGTELYRFDPAIGEAERLTNLQAESLKPSHIVSLGGVLYFSGQDEETGRELWSYDPATSTLELVADILEGPKPSTPNFLAVFDDEVYFRAFTFGSKKELWHYDPDTGLAVQTPDIRDPDSAAPAEMIPLDGKLYFRAFDDPVGDELWRYDPETNAHTLVVDIVPGPQIGEPRHLRVVDGRLYFIARAPNEGPWQQIWEYDPTTDAAEMKVVLPAGDEGAGWRPEPWVEMGGSLYVFAGSDDGADDLWRFDPQTGDARKVADLPPGSDDRLPAPLAGIDGVLMFAASADDAGRELWVYDSGSGAIFRASDLAPGAASSDPAWPVVLDGAFYFSADDGANGRELWRFDPPPVAGEETPDALAVGEVAPNPSTGTARLRVRLAAPASVRVVVTDALGRAVAERQVSRGAGTHDLDVPTAGLAPGLYVLRVSGPMGTVLRRFTLAR